MDKRTYNDRREWFQKYYRDYYKTRPELQAKQLEKAKLRGEENRKKYLEWKSTLTCSKCSESEPCCLEFHHTNPGEKEYEVSKLSGKSMKAILKEAAKCIVVCSNCHKKIHARLIVLDSASVV